MKSLTCLWVCLWCWTAVGWSECKDLGVKINKCRFGLLYDFVDEFASWQKICLCTSRPILWTCLFSLNADNGKGKIMHSQEVMSSRQLKRPELQPLTPSGSTKSRFTFPASHPGWLITTDWKHTVQLITDRKNAVHITGLTVHITGVTFHISAVTVHISGVTKQQLPAGSHHRLKAFSSHLGHEQTFCGCYHADRKAYLMPKGSQLHGLEAGITLTERHT